MDTGIQLEMNFEISRNRLRSRIETGEFFVLFEVNTPSRQTDFNTSAERLRELEFAVDSIASLPAGLAITDKYTAADSWHIADFAAALLSPERDRHLVILSGRDTNSRTMAETIRLCHSAGLHNLLPVSGNSVSGENRRRTAARSFCESIHSIRMAREMPESGFFLGGVVNPFKYTASELFSQYFKLIKKINCGADFFVTQFGWDMLKIQELRWYLGTRGLHVPGLARIMMLTPERVENIVAGRYPGVVISADLQSILQNELKYSFAQFEAAQWRRIQLQAAGCRLMGYNGVQISGLERPDKVRIAAGRIAEALEEFRNFDDWRNAYNAHLARSEMAPYPYRFYLFSQPFTSACLPENGTVRMNEGKMPETTRRERLGYHWRRFLFAHAGSQPAAEHYILKRVVTGCVRCRRCRLPDTCYICPMTCPKGMVNGPCGGTRPGGKCELGDQECIHGRILRLARWRGNVDMFEDKFIPAGD